MDAFSFVFSLYSIVLGLALTEVFGGAARILKGRGRVRIGWLTTLLAATLVADITLFWRLIWGTRGAMPDTSAALFAGVVICGLYYFAAVLLFPDERVAGEDPDDHVAAEKNKVLGCIFAANVLTYSGRIALLGWSGSFGTWGWANWGEIAAFMTSCALAIVIAQRRAVLVLVSVMLAADLIDPLFSALGIG